jgi:acetyl-CoA carboxylase carboxyltransferase component
MTEPDEPLRDDHAELLRRRALTEDAARPEAVARRHAAGGRTARENIEDLVDAGSFVEYGRFAIAAQRFRPGRPATKALCAQRLPNAPGAPTRSTRSSRRSPTRVR